MSNENQILIDNCKPLIEKLIDKLNKEEIDFFSNIPKVVLSYKGEEIVVCFLSESNDDLIIELNQKPSNVKFCVFLKKEHLINGIYKPEQFAVDQLEKIRQELLEQSAYNINLERVDNLIINGQYAVALVFIISAFESVLSDILFRHNHLWFYKLMLESEKTELKTNKEDKFINENIRIFKKFGQPISPSESQYYHVIKEIDGKNWGVLPENSQLYERSKNNLIWQYIFETAKHLRVLDSYLLKIIGNKSRRLGSFEFLKDCLKNPNHLYQGINFQSIKEKNGVKKSFKRLYGIDLMGVDFEIKIIENTLQKRHQIIHGNLKDDEVKIDDVKSARDALIKIVNYIKDKISELNNQFLYHSIFFE